MKKEKRDWIFWTPRIVAILFTIFLALFSLDVFGEGLTFWQVVGAFLMHNIPVFILAAIIWISWKKHGWLAGIAFILAGLLYIGLTLRTAVINGFEWYYLAWIAQIAVPAFFIGILFFIDWRRKK